MASKEGVKFESDEILWFDNGRWGRAGYAIPNAAGKVWTTNTVIWTVHNMIGRNLFELMHRPAVKFSVPPHKQWFFDFHQLLITARKRLSDREVTPSSDNVLVPKHATPSPKVFLTYPIPFFGNRIRQLDLIEYAQLTLLLLSEMMQHTDNERLVHVTRDFCSTCREYIAEMLVLMATKYFGYTREQAFESNFSVDPERFTNYEPARVMTSIEMTDERPPLQWWPTENDLSEIRGVAYNEAMMFAKRWPATALLDDVAAIPGSGPAFEGPRSGDTEAGLAIDPTKAP